MNGLGHLSLHMLQHIAVMNVLVPLALLAVRDRLPAWLAWKSWPYATALQLVLLWAWHSPALLGMAMSSPLVMLAMHLSLAAAAAWFWATLFTMPVTGLWRALFALLVTGKLFCLLGALLVFAPRLLFPVSGHHGMTVGSIDDQQLAGLIMLTACPLTYVAIGIFMSARWFVALEGEPRG